MRCCTASAKRSLEFTLRLVKEACGARHGQDLFWGKCAVGAATANVDVRHKAWQQWTCLADTNSGILVDVKEVLAVDVPLPRGGPCSAHHSHLAGTRPASARRCCHQWGGHMSCALPASQPTASAERPSDRRTHPANVVFVMVVPKSTTLPSKPLPPSLRMRNLYFRGLRVGMPKSGGPRTTLTAHHLHPSKEACHGLAEVILLGLVCCAEVFARAAANPPWTAQGNHGPARYGGGVHVDCTKQQCQVAKCWSCDWRAIPSC